MDLDLELTPLFEEAPSRVSIAPPQVEIECVRDSSDPTKGAISLTVRGFGEEDGRLLRRAYANAYRLLGAVHEARERRERELTPAADPIGAEVARVQAQAEAAPYLERASLALLKSCRDICALGVVGWPAGQLKHRGEALVYTTEEREVLGKRRHALALTPLLWLELGGFTVQLAALILVASKGERVPTKEEQWGRSETRASAPFSEAGAPPTPAN